MSECPVSKLLRKLKHFAGLPVPVITKWVDGKPDFRQIDGEQWKRIVENRLCPICGEPLGEYCFYVGGDLSLANALFTDPPMHGGCARESMRLCPFLNGKRSEYRGDVPDAGLLDTNGRPATMYLMRGATRRMAVVQVGQGVAVYAGKLSVMETF